MPPMLPHWDWQAKRGTLAGVVRPPLLRMNWSVKRRYDAIAGGAGENVLLCELLANFLLLFWHAHAHPLVMRCWRVRICQIAGQNFTLCDALIATEGG